MILKFVVPYICIERYLYKQKKLKEKGGNVWRSLLVGGRGLLNVCTIHPLNKNVLENISRYVNY